MKLNTGVAVSKLDQEMVRTDALHPDLFTRCTNLRMVQQSIKVLREAQTSKTVTARLILNIRDKPVTSKPGVSYILPPITAALSHTKSAPTVIFRHSCRVHSHDKRDNLYYLPVTGLRFTHIFI
jgi:hypothetical protein